MNKFKPTQKGFSAVEALLILVIVAMVSGIGWYVMSVNKDQGSDSSSGTQSSQEVPAVNNADDLEAAEEYVNNTNIDEALDTSEIDAVLE